MLQPSVVVRFAADATCDEALELAARQRGRTAGIAKQSFPEEEATDLHRKVRPPSHGSLTEAPEYVLYVGVRLVELILHACSLSMNNCGYRHLSDSRPSHLRD